MHNNVEHKTPSPTPPTFDVSGTATADQIGRLSLDTRQPHNQSRRGRGILSAGPATASKRAASSELYRPPGRRSPAGAGFRQSQAGVLRHQRAPYRSQRKGSSNANQNATAYEYSHPTAAIARALNQHHSGYPSNTISRDSGYGSLPSRSGTLQPDLKPTPADDQYVSVEPLSTPSRSTAKGETQHVGGVSVLRSKSRYPGLILQPESSPISQDQLAAEVKGIYGGLVMVEAKCINIDAAQAADPTSSLGAEQWQALIALHRTLLYEHHDFLMATQHPSATPALRGLAQKYSMPARMWRHAIHAFLEVLRHRRPQSQDYMVAFVYLAYQMMALLYETVPTFTDTWIECLGDLARYRMAIEDNKEIHTIWGGVAESWYNRASDKHPSIGRLYHHLGILERPSLRKQLLYAKALTCVIPFPNARDSMGTFCAPLMQDEHIGMNGMRLAEARVVRFHAYHFMVPDHDKLSDLGSDAISGLDQCPAVELRETGVLAVITNIAALQQFGAAENIVWQLFGNAINADIQSSRPSAAASESYSAGSPHQSITSPTIGTSASGLIYDFCYYSFRSLTQRGSDPSTTQDLLRAVHAMLVWLHSIHVLRTKVKNDHDLHTLSSLMGTTRFPWGGLCSVLNIICQNETIDPRIMEYARQEIFPTAQSNDANPLSEDYLLRGLSWTQWYYPIGFFGDQSSEGEAFIESSSPAAHQSRVDRIQWLGLYLAFHNEHIKFNDQTNTFSTLSTHNQLHIPTETAEGIDASPGPFVNATSPKPSSPTASSQHSDSDGYMLVQAPKTKTPTTWASVVSNSSKSKRDERGIHIVDCEHMQWEE